MNHQLRDQLIAAEPEDQALRGEYERRLTAMIEKPLTLPRKAGLSFAMLVSAATIVISIVIAVRFRHGPAVVLEGMALGIVFGIAALVLVGRILIRGTYRLDRDSSMQAGLIWAFIVLLVTLFMVAGGIKSIQGVGLIVVGLVFLVGAGVLLLRTVIEQSELRTREKLLEVELHLARLSEELKTLRRGSGQ